MCQGQVKIQSVIVYRNVGVDMVISARVVGLGFVSVSVTVSAQKYVE